MAEILDITRLITKERLDLIGELWDSLAPEDIRSTPATRAAIRHLAGPDVVTIIRTPLDVSPALHPFLNGAYRATIFGSRGPQERRNA